MSSAFQRGCAWCGVVLAGSALAACGATHSSPQVSPTPAAVAPSRRSARRPVRPLAAAVRSALSSLASTPYVFEGTRIDRVAGRASEVTVHGAFDPATRDGESTEIAGTGAVAAGYGASRVVSDRAWALVEGSWYSVPLGRVPVGQILAACDLLSGSHAQGIGQDGARVVAGPRALARLRRRLPASLVPALAGLDRVSIVLVAAGTRPSELEFRARGALGSQAFRSTGVLHLSPLGSAVVVHPPASEGVLDVGPPATALPPL